MNKISDAVNVANHQSPLCITNHPGFDSLPQSMGSGDCLHGTTIGNNMMKDLMDQNIKEIGMSHIDNWLCGVGGN